MKLKLFFFLLIPFLGISQVQIGQKILGENIYDWSGKQISLSADGTVVAIGAEQNSGNGNRSGHVRIYKKFTQSWIQLGQDIDGEAAEDYSGSSVSLSADGSIVAIGANGNSGNGYRSGHTRIYQYSQVQGWVQIGQDIDGESAENYSGGSVSLSADGTIVAIGAIGNSGSANNGTTNNSGHVRVFKNSFGIWTQIGQDINGEAFADGSGGSVALSSDGNIVAIGAANNSNINGVGAGHVRVYENVLGTWTQVGQDIDGEYASNRFGHRISLSSNGKILAVGAPWGLGPTLPEGYVAVYENISGVWTKIGENIYGEALEDINGWSVSLSANGNIVAIGAYGNDVGGYNSGHVRIYRNVMGDWIQEGTDINGGHIDWLGYSVSISSNGEMVAVGAIDVANNNRGYVKIFDLSKPASSHKFVLDNFNIYPNPASDILNISLENNLVFEKAVIYNNLGQIVKEANQEVIDVSALAKGIYFVEVTTNQGKATKKVIIK